MPSICQVNQLVRKCYLKREPKKARGIAIERELEDDVSYLVASPFLARWRPINRSWPGGNIICKVSKTGLLD